MPYWYVLRDGQRFPPGTTVKPGDASKWGKLRWNLNAPFMFQEPALEAALAYLQTHDADLTIIQTSYRLGGVHVPHGRVVWWSKQRPSLRARFEGGTEVSPAEVKLPQPINVDREQVVEVLQKNLDEAAAERQKIEDKERQARLDVDQFVTDHQDEIVEWFGRYFDGTWKQVAETLENLFKDDAFKPVKLKKTAKETDLEKMVRVLGMSVDKTIEVQPDSSIYSLL